MVGTDTATVLCIEYLQCRTLGRFDGALAVAGVWVEVLCLAAPGIGGTFTSACLTVELLAPRTVCHRGTLTFACVTVEHFASSALLVVPIHAVAVARCPVEDPGFGTRGGIDTRTLASLVVKHLGWRAVAFRLAHTPATGIAEGFLRRAHLRSVTDAAADISVEGVGRLAGLSAAARTCTGFLVECEGSRAGLFVQHALALAGLWVEYVPQRALLVATPALAASAAKILACRALFHHSTVPHMCFSQL